MGLNANVFPCYMLQRPRSSVSYIGDANCGLQVDGCRRLEVILHKTAGIPPPVPAPNILGGALHPWCIRRLGSIDE